MATEAEEQLSARVSALSLERKVALLSGADFWALAAEPALGLRRIVLSDGPAGVRGERWDERSPSANVPSATALAATWDEARVERIGDLLAFEARRKGVDVLLAPTVSLYRTPFDGRHSARFSEDPLLTARIGCAYVNGLQRAGVGAAVQHLRSEEFTSAAPSEPFETIVREARPWALLAADTAMTESPLLDAVLRDEWGFDGVVVSAWFTTRSTVAAALAGLDLAMPGPSGPWGDALVQAVRDGSVPEATIDAKVRNLLRLADRVGALADVIGAAPPDGADADAAEARTRAGASGTAAVSGGADTSGSRAGASADTGPSGGRAGESGIPAGASAEAGLSGDHEDDVAGAKADAGPAGRPGAWSEAAIAAELRSTAAAGIVLARNHGALLPLTGGSLRRVAVIGPSAAAARTHGGGRATVFPPYAVSPLDGLRAALPRAQVSYAPGVRASERPTVADLDVEVRLLTDDDLLLASERRHTGRFVWTTFGLGERDAEVRTIEIRATLRADVAGEYEIGASGTGRFALALDGAPAFDITLAPTVGDAPAGVVALPQHAGVRRMLAHGESVELTLRRAVDRGDAPIVSFTLDVDPPRETPERELARALDLAREADVAIVVVGTTEEVESEGVDRTTLALPGAQDELVRRVNEACPRTIAVIDAGTPVLVPWAGRVPAILLAGFGGQEAGNALADVLLGATEPGGRLPTTWPASEDGPPIESMHAGRHGVAARDASKLPERAASSDDGPLGDRRPAAPLYPFGHGLGYTSWDYLGIEPLDGAVRVHVVNSGTRRGREVVQLYARRPELRLVGFAGVEAAAGERVEVEIAIPRRALARWDEHGWTVEPGTYEITAGRSVADLRVSAEIDIA